MEASNFHTTSVEVSSILKNFSSGLVFIHRMVICTVKNKKIHYENHFKVDAYLHDSWRKIALSRK